MTTLTVLKAWFNHEEAIDLNCVHVQQYLDATRKHVILHCLSHAKKEIFEKFDELHPTPGEYDTKKRQQLTEQLNEDIARIQSLEEKELHSPQGNYFVYLFDLEYHFRVL